MTSGFGGQGYVSQESRALSRITETPGPDLSQGQEAQLKMLQGHDAQIKFLATQVDKALKGVNEATQNPIQQLQQFVADIMVLLGGGQLVKGALDFGDLQYILPALGALFGFSGDSPFPISLFEAASKMFFGYIVPQQQFVDLINQIIENWLGLLGINKEFIDDVQALVTAVGDLFGGIGNLFPTLNELFGALGLNGADLGPLGQLLKPVLDLFRGINLDGFGNIVDFITGLISPFVQGLTAIINWINSVLAIFGFHGGDVVNSPLADTTAPVEALVGDVSDAKTAANNALREINEVQGQLQAGDGAFYPENLDYANAAYLPSPYVVYESGPGGGSFGPDGNSALAWKQSGFSNRICAYRHPDFHITNPQWGCAMIVEQKAVNNGPAAFLGAVDASGNGIAMAVQQNNVALDKIVTGITTGGFNEQSTPTANGDTWKMYFGATVSGVFYPNAVYIYRNGERKWFNLDVQANYGLTLGADLYLYIGGRAIGSGFVQTVPPRPSSFTIFDSNFTTT